MRMGELLKSKVFWLLLVMMICAGASEQSISQWASAFAEKALGLSKAMGDLAGPMLFAILMGLSRVFYGKFGEKMQLNAFITGSLVLCVLSYLLVSLSPSPILSLVGCALSGLSVGILWPGTLSTASKVLRNGGTAMFALLALGGDVGCSAGPTLVGMVSDACSGNLKIGLLVSIIFPATLLVCQLCKHKEA